MGKPQTPPLPLWLIGFRNETLKPSLYHILLPHLHSCVVIAQLTVRELPGNCSTKPVSPMSLPSRRLWDDGGHKALCPPSGTI